MISVSITPLARGEHVDVVATGHQDEISTLAMAIDFREKYQRVPVSPDQELELGNLVDVKGIEFVDGGRWELRLRARQADVLRR